MSLFVEKSTHSITTMNKSVDLSSKTLKHRQTPVKLPKLSELVPLETSVLEERAESSSTDEIASEVHTLASTDHHRPSNPPPNKVRDVDAKMCR